MYHEYVVATKKEAEHVKPRVPAQKVTCFCSEDIVNGGRTSKSKRPRVFLYVFVCIYLSEYTF